jgi:hypothetical protein
LALAQHRVVVGQAADEPVGVGPGIQLEAMFQAAPFPKPGAPDEMDELRQRLADLESRLRRR